MEQPTTIADFLERTRASYDGYAGALVSFTDEQLVAPGTLGTWSVRDVMAHVGADEQWMAGQLEALRAGTEPTAASCYGAHASPPSAGIDMATQDGRNAWQRERLAGLSLDDVRSLAAEGHRRLMEAISSFSDGDLTMPLTIADLGLTGHIRRPREGETFAPPLWEWLRGVTYHHYDDHARALREAAS